MKHLFSFPKFWILNSAFCIISLLSLSAPSSAASSFITLSAPSSAAPALPDSAFFQSHPWRGKKVAYFGDSITDPNNKGSKKKYWQYLQEWLGIEYFVPAKSGRQWNDIARQEQLLQEKWGQDVDAIFIFLGTNDFNHDVPLGEWFTISEEKVMRAAHGKEKKPETLKHRVPNMDDSTFRGRINKALSQLKKDYADKQIILITPIHRAGFFPNDKNWQPEECYSNELGLFVDEYIQAVKEAGQIWAMPVIDMAALSALYPLEDAHGKFFANPSADRLHPNELGHERMAKVLAAQLMAIPVF